ncbi:MAG: NAD(P)-dependent oxidoreductase [Acidobacteriota bacterium]
MILVTGGTGFVGRALVPALLQRDHRIALLVRRPNGLTERGNTVVRQGDLLDPASLVAALEGVTTVVHLAAALPESGLPASEVRRVNVEGSENLARAAVRCKIVQFVHGSSAGVYGDGTTLGPHDESSPVAPTTVYEQTKLDAERAVVSELAHTPVVWSILRPSGLHGPGRLASARFLHRICHRPVWIHGPATTLLHPTYVGDFVAAILCTLGRIDLHTEIINIAGPRALTYRDLIELVASRLGVRVHQFQIPLRLPRSLGRLTRTRTRELQDQTTGIERLTRSVVNRSVDITKARRLLGFEPYPLERGLDHTIAWARGERLL